MLLTFHLNLEACKQNDNLVTEKKISKAPTVCLATEHEELYAHNPGD